MLDKLGDVHIVETNFLELNRASWMISLFSCEGAYPSTRSFTLRGGTV